MLITIILVLLGLVVFNFLLLLFSCNKTSKKVLTEPEESLLLKSVARNKTSQSIQEQLVPTGS